MPMIRIEMFAGRSPEQKQALVREVTDAFVRTAGGTAAAVQVVLTDVEKSDWAVAGKLASKS